MSNVEKKIIRYVSALSGAVSAAYAAVVGVPGVADIDLTITVIVLAQAAGIQFFVAVISKSDE